MSKVKEWEIDEIVKLLIKIKSVIKKIISIIRIKTIIIKSIK